MKKGLLALRTIFGSLLAIILVAILVAANTILPYYGRMVTEVIGYKQGYTTPAEVKNLDLQYNKADFANKEELKTAEQKLNEQIVAEGAVLLKHTEGYMPYNEGTEFSLFSHSAVDYLAGGYLGGKVTLKDALESRGFSVNQDLWEFYKNGNGSGYKRGVGSINYGAEEDFVINECPLNVIVNESGLTDSFEDTTAVFILSRVVGEGRDMPRSMYQHTDIPEDKVKNYLEPDSVELEILSYLNENFEDIVLLVNSSGAMELGWVEEFENIHTVLYTGLTGSYGLNSIADIFAGNVNPSGHLVDTYAYDAFSSAAAQNYGSYVYYTNDGKPTEYNYVSYAEGIYVGYKYYETRYEDVVLGQGNAGDYAYASTVQYPFGYGLSLTTFEWSDYTTSWDNDTCTVSVTVKNTGDVAGKEVVQVYAQSPYTDYDRANGIEKSAVQLVAYAKTAELKPGESETVCAVFDKEQLKAYDAQNAKTYIFDAGDYYITAAADAHKAVNNILAAKGKTVADGMTEEGNANFVALYVPENKEVDVAAYTLDTATGVTVTNQFDAAKGDVTYLTRSDWEGTFPLHDGEVSNEISTWGNEINGADADGNPASYTYYKVASDELLEQLASHASGNPTDKESLMDVIVYGAENGLSLIEMRGLEFDNPLWEDLLDQLTPEDYHTLITSSGYGTPALESVQKPYCMDADSATGLVFGGTGITYQGASILAQTWNDALAEDFGHMIGNAALLGSGTVGWYCPAINIHRTPFSGRNNEYYSEDGFLSGVVGSAVVRGSAEKGMYTFVKHFALNDQENHRGDGGGGGIATWSNEQAIREIYLKPFEMCMKEGTVTLNYVAEDENGVYKNVTTDVPACNALMTAFNRIGATWTGGHYNLLTNVLRGEWGFNGFVITDANSYLGHMDRRQMIEAGGDGSLRYYADEEFVFDSQSVSDYHYGRQAAHHILYTIANSKAMIGAMPGSTLTGMPTDKTLRIGLTIVSVFLLALVIYFIYRGFRPSKRKLARLEKKNG